MKPEMPNLPEEIIYDILSRLPVVSLCRFRCVSKSWRSLISHPRFVRAHLNRNNNNNKYDRLILSDDRDFYSVELDSSEFEPQLVAVDLNFPQDQSPTFCGQELRGSCDGLVLMVHLLRYEVHVRLENLFILRLVNPSTREYRELHGSPFTFDRRYRFDFAYGLGYDSSIDDYKVVIICYDEEVESTDNEVSVYALKTNSWRRIEKSPYDYSRFPPHAGAFVCGALHWIAVNGTDDVIAALGLTDEKFQTVPLPSPTLGFNFIGHELSVLGGCLCVFAAQFHLWCPCLDIWVMKEYGVRDSWMKLKVPYGKNIFCSWTPLSLSRTGQVLIGTNGYNLVLFDPREEESKELVVQGCPAQFDVGTYVESLVSPNRQC